MHESTDGMRFAPGAYEVLQIDFFCHVLRPLLCRSPTNEFRNGAHAAACGDP